MVHIPPIVVIGTYSMIVTSVLYLTRNNEFPRDLVRDMHTFIQ